MDLAEGKDRKVHSVSMLEVGKRPIIFIGWTHHWTFRSFPSVFSLSQSILLVGKRPHLREKTDFKLTYIEAHTLEQDEHSVGNENADRLANEAIGVQSCPYQKIYLEIPFKEKETAKNLGAKWDPKKKKWYISSLLSQEKKELIYEIFEAIANTWANAETSDDSDDSDDDSDDSDGSRRRLRLRLNRR